MRAVVQRVSQASVSVDGDVVGSCGQGLLVLLAAGRDDDKAVADRLAAKVARLRVFENDDARFDRSLVDVRGSALVVSQFTLLADTTKGTRPSFTNAARPRSRSRSSTTSLLRCGRRACRSRPGASALAWRSRS